MRPGYEWRLRTRSLKLGERTILMGVVNVTPDSFSDGGEFFAAGKAVEHALALLDEGADIIDVGGESTRPGARVWSEEEGTGAAVSAEEELRRVLPVIRELKRMAPEAIISVDTYKSEVARQAVEAGAEIVNDVSALRWDRTMAITVADLGCGVVLMHMRGRPEEWRSLPRLGGDELLGLVSRELRQWAQTARDAGITPDRIVLDPGFGFGKNFEENYPLLARMGDLNALGYPLLAGTSRKSFLGKTIGGATPAPPRSRLYGTLASVTAAILAGAHIVRVHDVVPAREAAAVADAILSEGK